MTRQDKLIAAVRSAAAYLGTLLIGWLLSLGIDLPDEVDQQVMFLLPVFGVFLYNYAANWLASRWPGFGFLLLVPKQPAYDRSKPVLTPDTPPAIVAVAPVAPVEEEGGYGLVEFVIGILVIIVLVIVLARLL